MEDIHDDDRLSLNDRIYISSKIYQLLHGHFAHWYGLSQDKFEEDYRTLIDDVTDTDDRYSFDMHMMEFLAKLRNGHTWFSDNWLNRNFNQAMPIEVVYDFGKWVIYRSAIGGIVPGMTIDNINGVTLEEYYASKRARISASSEREARSRFCEQFYLFPREFVLELDGRGHTVKRERASYFPKKSVEGYWLERGRVAIIKINQFSKATEEDAIGFVKEFFDAKRIIVDVRGNRGGSTPLDLIKILMDRPFGLWRESTPLNIGLFRFYADYVRQNRDKMTQAMQEKLSLAEVFSTTELSWAPEEVENSRKHFDGELFIITDRYCRSAGEDFVLPFKETGRAVVIGEATMGTSGQPYVFSFEDGIQAFIATKRVSFSDGSRFEGVGIHPDVSVMMTIEDISMGRDPLVEYCLDH
ncbi:MAG: hypothetical protein JW825_07155 [Candidatus Methanofastidiosa archaeon]|nr:hypothetical protein [Candidatus Methanofastidiosa archaeon]